MDVQLIAGSGLATLFAGGGPPVVHQWQITPSDSRLRAISGPPVFFLSLIGFEIEPCWSAAKHTNSQSRGCP